MAERRAVRRRPDDERGQVRRRVGRADADEAEDLEEPESRDDGEEEDEEEEQEEQTHERRRQRRRASDGELSAAQAAKEGLRQIAQLTGKQAEGVTGVEPTDDGWLVGVEIIEDQRVPSSADILAIYETEIDMDGELTSYRRVRRYARGRGDGNEES